MSLAVVGLYAPNVNCFPMIAKDVLKSKVKPTGYNTRVKMFADFMIVVSIRDNFLIAVSAFYCLANIIT